MLRRTYSARSFVFCHSEATRLMQQHNIRRLPVLSRDKRLVGIVSLGDIAVGSNDESGIAQTEGDIASSPPNN